jgi:broad specificity phosphatase PhoE
MKPNRIFLIRHGESQGNIDKHLYSKIPDYAIYLTQKGIEQAKEAGQIIKNIIKNESYCAYFSPYFRARQTMDIALNELNPLNLQFLREEPRIREQEYAGKLQTGRHDNDKERESYGKFFYRMNGGESGADVYDRVSDAIGTMNRDFLKPNFPSNVLIFGHGMANRLFLVRWLHIPIEEFETWKNPKNGEIYLLEQNNNDKYELKTPIEKYPNGYGYKYNPKY